MKNDFDFILEPEFLEDEPMTRIVRTEMEIPFLWFKLFTSITCALVLSALLIGLGVRAYIWWSIADTVNQMEQHKTK
jgi:hypothetical protein